MCRRCRRPRRGPRRSARTCRSRRAARACRSTAAASPARRGAARAAPRQRRAMPARAARTPPGALRPRSRPAPEGPRPGLGSARAVRSSRAVRSPKAVRSSRTRCLTLSRAYEFARIAPPNRPGRDDGPRVRTDQPPARRAAPIVAALVAGVLLLTDACSVAVPGIARPAASQAAAPATAALAAQSDPAGRVAEATAAAVQEFWRAEFPAAFGREWRDVSTFVAVPTADPGAPPPPCVNRTADVAGQAFYCPDCRRGRLGRRRPDTGAARAVRPGGRRGGARPRGRPRRAVAPRPRREAEP